MGLRLLLRNGVCQRQQAHHGAAPRHLRGDGAAPHNRGPYLGEQTEKILKDLGYSDQQVAAMIAAGEAVPMDPDLRD